MLYQVRNIVPILVLYFIIMSAAMLCMSRHYWWRVAEDQLLPWRSPSIGGRPSGGGWCWRTWRLGLLRDGWRLFGACLPPSIHSSPQGENRPPVSLRKRCPDQRIKFPDQRNVLELSVLIRKVSWLEECPVSWLEEVSCPDLREISS